MNDYNGRDAVALLSQLVDIFGDINMNLEKLVDNTERLADNNERLADNIENVADNIDRVDNTLIDIHDVMKEQE